ncbi:Alkaline serine protease (VapT) [Vibrio nigripulchritudo SOn1]|uniref:Alkaline serine protease (VapT) n=1 Tax=Vibrio nigripulchritudo SOn1 TaxID=1238450 RepID=A0AAV2VY33_9VIBR|nr:Alkaline serine protease (VapT) [Vibrio nigripulchritudo SOn1]
MIKLNRKNVGLFKPTVLALAMFTSGYAVADNFTQVSEAELPVKYLVKFKSNMSKSPARMGLSQFAGERIVQESVLDRINAQQIEKLGDSSVYSVEVDQAALSALQHNLDVEYVEIDQPRFLLSELTPWGQDSVGATLLSDVNAGNRTVCIIDSGYDLAHTDLATNQVTGTNDKGTGDWSVPGAGNAHGTHVAGTIAAVANNTGVVGVMPNQNVNLHIIKVFSESGWTYSSGLVKAVDTCVSNGANVVNMSLGGNKLSVTEKAAFKRHSDNGVLFIASAGNDGNTKHKYPASYDSVVSVAAVDTALDHAAFSQATNQVEIAAPGVAVLSTVTMGEGVLADIEYNAQSYFNRGIVPHNRYIKNALDKFEPAKISGTQTAPAAVCDTTTGKYVCGDMKNKVCVVERIENQRPGLRPEIDAVKACYDAGASAAIVYSNSELTGLQNPFVVDAKNEAPLLSVTVDRTLGQEFAAAAGQPITVSVTTGEDYAYYNGTSMAAPHAAGVAALVWSYHPQCTAAQVRKALSATATDLDVAGRDNRTGHGLVNAVAAKEYLDLGCNGGEPIPDPAVCDATGLNVYPNWPQADWAGNPNHAGAGDKLVHNGAVYQANWWTRSIPGSDNSWSHVCDL